MLGLDWSHTIFPFHVQLYSSFLYNWIYGVACSQLVLLLGNASVELSSNIQTNIIVIVLNIFQFREEDEKEIETSYFCNSRASSTSVIHVFVD